MAEYRPPGVYFEQEFNARFTPLHLHKTGIPCFIGITQKGPTNVPVKITDMESFYEIFGKINLDNYLEVSVKGFFENGGDECYILRVAHQTGGRGEKAKIASFNVKNRLKKDGIMFLASSEGEWGNSVKVTLKNRVGRANTLLTLDVDAGEDVLTLKSSANISIGSVIRIYDYTNEEYRVVIDMAGKEVLLNEPVSFDFKSSSPTFIESYEMDISVHDSEKSEQFLNLSLAKNSDRYFVKIINGMSRLIRVVDLMPELNFPDKFVDDIENRPLEGGQDGIFSITPSDFIGMSGAIGERTGLMALEQVMEVDLIVAPDLMWCKDHSHGFRSIKDVQIVQQEILNHCEKMGERFAILDAPRFNSIEGIKQWKRLFDSDYGAIYFPWITVNHNGKTLTIPPSGFVAGIFARVDKSRGVFNAPANETLENVYDLELNLHDKDIGELNREGINCLKYFSASGIKIWGARTLSSDVSKKYINVRREINAIKKSLSIDLQWVVFEPNNQKLWKKLTTEISFFLYDLWKMGFFKGRVPEEAFFVKCDDENNPPEVRDNGIIMIDIGVAPIRPAEFITFSVSQSAGEQGTA